MSFEWATEDTRTFLSRGYLLEGETVESRVEEIADTFGDYMGASEEAYGIACRGMFYEYMSKGFYSLSSPVWANYGRARGLPISCNGSYIPDSVEGMKQKDAEIAVMTKHGAGTSAYLGDIRPRGSEVSVGGYADGVALPAGMLEATIGLISQGNVRRGNIAFYYPIEGADFWEYMGFREEGSPVQSSSLGLTVTDAFMEQVKARDKEATKRWLAVIKKRFESGYPYIMYIDTVNRNKPSCYKDYPILASNLCAEIALPSSVDESFVCCLSSMNLEKFDEWKDTQAVEVMVYFLDSVMEEYCTKTKGMVFMESAHNFAKRHRALGLGTLGYHSYLQKKGWPFESLAARAFNSRVHKLISERAKEASERLAGLFGPCEVEPSRRNTTLMAIAPTTSSSFILGQVSPSIEPLASNYFVKDLAKGSFTYKNPYLMAELEKTGNNTTETWGFILDNGGSVQKLPDEVLSKEMKEVFKTFSEISPMEVVTQAADRQRYVDQSQSVNLMIDANAPLKDVNQLMFSAWEMGVKTLYYQRGTNPAQEAVKNITSCVVCEA